MTGPQTAVQRSFVAGGTRAGFARSPLSATTVEWLKPSMPDSRLPREELVVQLDGDATVETPGWLERMADFYTSDDSIGVVTPL